jgi:hypothetical protein
MKCNNFYTVFASKGSFTTAGALRAVEMVFVSGPKKHYPFVLRAPTFSRWEANEANGEFCAFKMFQREET